MLAAAEEARANAEQTEMADDDPEATARIRLHRAYWEGQRDMLAAITRSVIDREVYDTEDAEFEDDIDIVSGTFIPPVQTPLTHSLWPKKT